MKLSRLEFDPNRQSAEYCPCGKSNHDGKFSPFVGYRDKGYCHSCLKTFFPDSPKGAPSIKEKKAVAPIAPPSFMLPEVLRQSLGKYDENTLMVFLGKLTSLETAVKIRNDYFIGTSRYWKGSTVFWQINIQKKILNGKIMQYALCPDENSSIGLNCCRVRTNALDVKWIHKLMKLWDFKLKQCFFGEHLLAKFPDRKVGILESEKSALIASAYHPDIIWLASAGVGGLKDKKTKVLEGRDVTLFPDLKMFEVWKEKAANMRKQLPKAVIRTSDVLERMATEDERTDGLDLADFLIRREWSKYAKANETA